MEKKCACYLMGPEESPVPWVKKCQNCKNEEAKETKTTPCKEN